MTARSMVAVHALRNACLALAGCTAAAGAAAGSIDGTWCPDRALRPITIAGDYYRNTLGEQFSGGSNDGTRFTIRLRRETAQPDTLVHAWATGPDSAVIEFGVGGPRPYTTPVYRCDFGLLPSDGVPADHGTLSGRALSVFRQSRIIVAGVVEMCPRAPALIGTALTRWELRHLEPQIGAAHLAKDLDLMLKPHGQSVESAIAPMIRRSAEATLAKLRDAVHSGDATAEQACDAMLARIDDGEMDVEGHERRFLLIYHRLATTGNWR